MPGAVVIPNPSCPVARKRFSWPGQGPISGSLSGVAARKPVQVRIAESALSPGMYSQARSIILPRIPGSTSVSSTPNWRDEPISNCPVRRG